MKENSTRCGRPFALAKSKPFQRLIFLLINHCRTTIWRQIPTTWPSKTREDVQRGSAAPNFNRPIGGATFSGAEPTCLSISGDISVSRKSPHTVTSRPLRISILPEALPLAHLLNMRPQLPTHKCALPFLLFS